MGYTSDSRELGDIIYQGAQVINSCCWDDLHTCMDQGFIAFTADLGPDSTIHKT